MEKQQKFDTLDTLEEIKSQIGKYNSTLDDVQYVLIPFKSCVSWLKEMAEKDGNSGYLCTNCEKELAYTYIDNGWQDGGGVTLCKKCIHYSSNFLG